MDIEKAKFILNSFRPDGQDAHDEMFTEALSLAAENRELGEWLSQERARDSTFASAMESLTIPAELKDDILSSLSPDFSSVNDPELDTAFFNAFDDVEVPEGLRDQILNAADVEQKVVKNAFPIWKVLPFAAAAVVAISAVIVMDFGPKGTEVADNKDFIPDIVDQPVTPVVNVVPDKITSDKKVTNLVEKLNVHQVQVQAVRDLKSKGVQQVSNSVEESMNWLKAKELPVAEVPKALNDMTCLGVSEFNQSGGARGSIVQFESDAGEKVNMLVLAVQGLVHSSE